MRKLKNFFRKLKDPLEYVQQDFCLHQTCRRSKVCRFGDPAGYCIAKREYANLRDHTLLLANVKIAASIKDPDLQVPLWNALLDVVERKIKASED